MPKDFFAVKICDAIAKYSIYALIFLLPLFFLPWTADVFDFNKQSLLLVLVFVSVLSLMVKILVSGQLEINKSAMHIAAVILFLAYLFATVFSSYKYSSFWGGQQQLSESLLTIICLLFFYFLVSAVFSKKDILVSAIILSFSAITAELVGLLQLLGHFILPFDFTKIASFNTLGPTGSLGFFAAMLFPLAFALLIVVKKWWRIFFLLQILVTTFLLVLTDYSIIWWVAIIVSALILMMGTLKRDLFDGRWMAFPMFFLTISLFFALLNPQISWLGQRTNEFFLSQQAGMDIGVKAVKERPLFGSGPGTFAYDFSKFKSPDFNKTSLWNVNFNESSSKVLNSLATTGLLGFLALLLFMFFPIFSGVKFFVSGGESDGGQPSEKFSGQVYSILLMGLCVAIIAQSIAYFIYNSNITLDFVYFFAIAALAGLVSENRKKYQLKPSSFSTLVVTLIFTIIFIFGVGVLVLDGQRYLAEVYYYKGLVYYQKGQQASGLKKLESSAGLNPSYDLYFRQLSQAYLLDLQSEMQNVKSAGSSTISSQETAKLQSLMTNAVNSAKIATDLYPQSSADWSSRGYIYQSLLGISGGAPAWAINSYDSALKLDPNNPYLYLQEGNVYLSEAINLSSTQSSGQKDQLLAKAQKQLEKAMELNPNYSDALYSLGIAYDASGQESKAITAFTRLQQLNPANADISKALASLKTGDSLLPSAVPPAENPPGSISGAANPPAKTTTKTKTTE